MSIEMNCPYCHKKVRAGRIRWLTILLSLLFGFFVPYVVYALFSSSRVCHECKRRIWPPLGESKPKAKKKKSKK